LGDECPGLVLETSVSTFAAAGWNPPGLTPAWKQTSLSWQNRLPAIRGTTDWRIRKTCHCRPKL